MKKRSYQILFVLILLLAIAVRGYKLASNPPGLYWEEVALGYDGYSLWQTGRDHHGNPWPIVAFESFGDYKPSLYFYLVAPFVGLLGLNAWAVRLPSLIAGVAVVIGVGQFVKLIATHDEKQQRSLTLLGMVVTAVSPWAMHFSRAAWESHVATALILWGVIFGWRFLRSTRLKHLYLSTVLFLLSLYAYHAARFVAPVLGLAIVVLKFIQPKQLLQFVGKKRLKLAPLLLLVIVMTAPFVISFRRPELTQRFSETSLFSDLALIKESNRLKEMAGNTLMARVVYHRYLLYGRKILENIWSHFNLDFLFISGDANPRHSIQYFGHFYHFELFLLLLGSYWLIKNKPKVTRFMFFWLLVGLIPVALTKTTPHALRILHVLPIFTVAITYGIYHLWQLYRQWLQRLQLQRIRLEPSKWLWLLPSIIAAAYLLEFSWYQHYFFHIYLKNMDISGKLNTQL